MSKYDDLFDDTAPDDSVFADKSALDPLIEPDEIVARDAQERELATLLNSVNEGYLPTTVSVYGPPGSGKTLTVRQREAVAAALSLGYYDYPRQTSAEDVAATMDCAPSTAVEHLRKAEGKLVRTAFDGAGR